MAEEQELTEARAKRQMYDAFHQDGSDVIKRFRDYWRAGSEELRRSTRVIDDVLGGKTLMSVEAVENCREAVMRVQQYSYVIGQLSLYLGKAENKLSIDAAMDVVVKATDAASNARKSMEIIYGWVAAAEPPKQERQ